MESYKIKQVIIVRKELGMNMGKTAAQVAHASMAFMTKRINIGEWQNKVKPAIWKKFWDYNLPLQDIEVAWLDESFAKIVVYVETLEELHELQNKAVEAGIEANFIIDSGHTYFKGEPTATCLALGPDYSEKLDPITRGLPLL